MLNLRAWLHFLVLPTAGLVLASCADVSTPTQPSFTLEPQLATSTGATLIECPVDTTSSASATIGALGGALELNGHRISVPRNAVLLPTEFTLTVPASNYMEVNVTANGKEHFQFNEPVSLTISYERCTRSNIDKANLKIFYIDSATKELLQDMGGTDDKDARTVTTTTDHLSGYAVADG